MLHNLDHDGNEDEESCKVAAWEIDRNLQSFAFNERRYGIIADNSDIFTGGRVVSDILD